MYSHRPCCLHHLTGERSSRYWLKSANSRKEWISYSTACAHSSKRFCAPACRSKSQPRTMKVRTVLHPTLICGILATARRKCPRSASSDETPSPDPAARRDIVEPFTRSKRISTGTFLDDRTVVALNRTRTPAALGGLPPVPGQSSAATGSLLSQGCMHQHVSKYKRGGI